MEILLRKQPPSSSASFYERMKFLIEDDSVQSYATLSSFNQRFARFLLSFLLNDTEHLAKHGIMSPDFVELLFKITDDL